MNQAIKIKNGVGDFWQTPKDLFAEINNEFFIGTPFDPCPGKIKLINSYSAEDFDDDPEKDGLKLEWHGENFVNPPFSDIPTWVERAWASVASHKKTIMLLPVRSDQEWFHDFVDLVCFIRGRVQYVFPGQKRKGCSFPSCLLFFGFSAFPRTWYPECHKNRRKKK